MPSTSAANPPGEKELQSVSKSFATAQTSASTHRRTIASLHKTFLACAAYKIEHNGQTRFAGEKLFMNKFRDCLYRVLPVKKGEQSAERVMKFVGGFAAFAFEGNPYCFYFLLFCSLSLTVRLGGSFNWFRR